MAHIRLQPPDPFNFHNPDDWLRWKRRFKQFCEASGLSEEAATKQIGTLLYCLGEEVDAVLSSTNPTAEECLNYDSTLAKFDSFLQVRKNVIYERARFNKRNQQSRETAEEYIVALYDLVENCDYGNLKEEMIRDRLVVGIRDSALSEKLQTDPKLTLEKAKMSIRQREAIHEQQQALKSKDKSTDDSSLDAFQSKRQTHPRNWGRRSERREHTPTGSRQQLRNARPERKCGHCGREQHPCVQCPARDVQCHNGNKMGHYSAQCRQKIVSTVLEGDTFDSTFLDTMSSDKKNGWISNIKVEGKEIPFKLDTGAEVTAVAKKTWQMLGKSTLQPPNKQLFGPTQQPLEVLGRFNCHFEHKGRQVQHQAFVVDHLKTNLLGLPAITALQLAVRLDSLQTPTTAEDIQRKLPKVFQGLGTLVGEYHIQLRPDAKPHASSHHDTFLYLSAPKSNKNSKEWRRQE